MGNGKGISKDVGDGDRRGVGVGDGVPLGMLYWLRVRFYASGHEYAYSYTSSTARAAGWMLLEPAAEILGQWETVPAPPGGPIADRSHSGVAGGWDVH